ncbi:hypothetical protein IC582_014815 [Cucumis melo]
MMIRTMSESMVEFAIIAQRHLGTVNDLKHMIRNCEHLTDGELGLKRLVELLDVNDTIFNGGFDSLLIALAYMKMKKTLKFSLEITNGFLYGFQYRIRGYRTFCYPITYYPNSLPFQNFQQPNNYIIILPKLIAFPQLSSRPSF